MKRILVLGNSGSGKSTMAKLIGEKLNIKVHHIDSYFWGPNWNPIPKTELKDCIREIIKNDSWVIDGNYSSSLDIRLKEADTLIYLNYPTSLSLYRVIKRRIMYHNKTRPDMGEGCNEKIDLEFLKWIIGFKRKNRPKLMKLIEENFDGDIIFINNKSDYNKFVKELDERSK